MSFAAQNNIYPTCWIRGIEPFGSNYPGHYTFFFVALNIVAAERED